MSPRDSCRLPPPLEPDRAQLGTFVRTMFKHATPGNWVSLRSFPDDDAKAPPSKITAVRLNGKPEILIDKAYNDALLAAKAERRTVFCPPVATFAIADHAREQDLAEGVAVSVECDKHPQAARKQLETLLGPATIVVESGGTWTDPETGTIEAKLHAHYRLKIPARGAAELAKLKQARALATKIVAGDPTNIPITHPIRWPGSWHRKGEPKLCRIISTSDHEIDLEVALQALQAAAPAAAASNDNPHDNPPTRTGQTGLSCCAISSPPRIIISRSLGWPPNFSPAACTMRRPSIFFVDGWTPRPAPAMNAGRRGTKKSRML